MGSEAFGIGAVLLLMLFPFGLLAAVWGLGALEEWVVRPSEHAAEVERLLALEDPETIEHVVAGMLAENADLPGRRVRTSLPGRRVRTSLALKRLIRQSRP